MHQAMLASANGLTSQNNLAAAPNPVVRRGAVTGAERTVEADAPFVGL